MLVDAAVENKLLDNTPSKFDWKVMGNHFKSVMSKVAKLIDFDKSQNLDAEEAFKRNDDGKKLNQTKSKFKAV